MTALNQPPPSLTPITDQTWKEWLYDVWAVLGESGQGNFPKLLIDTATFSGENSFQELLNMDKGLYVTYSSTNQNIIYGFACNVHRAAGAAFVVGAQINAWGEVGSTGSVFGIATTALGQPQSGTRSLIAFEPDVASLCNSSTGAKWGMNPVFKDRLDGATAAADGLGSNLYNYSSVGVVFTSQPRSSSTEFCGWNVGIDFFDASLDQASFVAWSALNTYSPGVVVSSGGVLWKAIQSSLNQLPAVGSAYWVQRTASGTSNLAVGIDFSSMSITSMARMASAIRLRSTMYVHWEETGAVGTKFDAATSIHHLSNNAGTLIFGVNVTTGVFQSSQTATALGGGAAATLGTIGGSGPTSAAQAGWEKVVLNGTTYYRPVWT